MAPAYSIDAVDRTLQVLLLLENQDRITVTEAGKRLGISRSSAFRLLNVMQQRDFVTQDPQTKTYQAGPALLRVGLATIHRSDLRAELRPLLEKVSSAFDETAHLIVLQGEQAFFLDSVESTRVVRAVSRVGTSLPAHCTSGGKVLLADLPGDQLDLLLRQGLSGLTKRSKRSITSVRQDLAATRKRGWAVNNEESEAGLRAVAVLVPHGLSQSGVSAAISISGPAERLDQQRLEEIATRMLEITAAATLNASPTG
jgi:IclR family transcriptional regulator, acetate operon repressor